MQKNKRIPQRKPEKDMSIPELVQKLEKKTGAKPKTFTEQLKEIGK